MIKLLRSFVLPSNFVHAKKLNIFVVCDLLIYTFMLDINMLRKSNLIINHTWKRCK